MAIRTASAASPPAPAARPRYHRAVRSRLRALALPALLVVVSCGGARAPAAPAAAKTAPGATSAAAPADAKLVEMVTPSRLLPDLAGERGVVAHDGGQRRVLLDRMRMITRDDGAIERATELLPRGNVSAVALPSRLGGGYLFHANTGSGAQLWRATDWLSRLRPLVQLSAVVDTIVPGFDRLYVRYQSNGRLAAIDADTGEPRGLGTLPAAAAYGRLAFADGWRAVVDTDLRGPLATFDAGATWRSVGVAERPLSIDVVNGDPAVTVAGGRYLVDARGAVTFRPDTPREPGAPSDDLEIPTRQPGLLGKKPLRAALEDGFPDSLTTAIVARGGALVRVSLHDGTTLATAEDAYPDRLAACHALRIGAGYGFLCGERDGATTVSEFAPPFALRPALRFAKPRFVAASGNGAIVVRGACEDPTSATAAAIEDSARPYCIRSAAGELHEIRIKGEIGVERVIALASGRVVVLVPPRGGSAGQITILGGSAATTLPLVLPSNPPFVDRLLRRGMWLDGFEERETGVLTGWVEAGGPVIGVRIKLDGNVTAGDVREDAGGAILAGRFGLSLGEGGRVAETTDGGLHWDVLDLPERDDEAERAGPTRACGPAGCVIGGWLRVGWGKAESDDDMRSAAAPPPSYTPTRSSPQIGFTCELGAVATPPLAVARAAAPKVVGKPASSAMPRPFGPAGVVATRSSRSAIGPGAAAPVTPNGWSSFRNTPAPALVDGEIGIDNGPYADTVMVHAYAWGKRGADWSRAGRWQVRFDDRFDAGGGVRSSAVSSSLWADEVQAAEAIGAGGYGAAAWAAYLDPSGKSAFTHACHGSVCSFFAVTEGQPVLPVRDAQGRSGTMLRPFPNGAVRVGETWYVITQGSLYEAVILWRIDLGVARQLGTYFRPARYGLESPRIVRRAFGGAVGLLVTGPPEPGDRVGSWYVLPVNPENGEISEAVQLVRRDLAGIALDRCAAGRDGWVIDTAFDTSASVEVNGSYGALDAIEMRARMDSGTLCIEALASRVDGLSSKPKTPGAKVTAPKPGPAAAIADAAAIPLAATERGTGRRWALSCKPRGLSGQKP